MNPVYPSTLVASPELNPGEKAAGSELRSLHLVFWDLFSDPENVRTWSGTPANIISGLRSAGQTVTTAGRPLPTLKKIIWSSYWHYYSRVRQLHYMADRHKAVTRLFSTVDNFTNGLAFDGADAVLTTSTAATAYLKTDKPIILIHDATWGQVLELYPYFHPSKLVPQVVSDGFAMERATFKRPNVTLVLSSQWAARRVLADYDLQPERIHILPLGAGFAADPIRKEVEQAILARKGEQCSLLFVGTEFDRKGGSIAVDAAEALRAMGIPTTLHVVGCSPKGLPSWVVTYGMLRKDNPTQLQTLLGLYASSDFFILPTRAEAQGIVFNEAAAYGLPVAATDVGGVSTVVPNGGWGVLLPLEADGKPYAAWIAELFKDRDRYRQTALNARDDYDSRLSRTAYTTQLLKIIRSVL